jgi:predicted ATPase/DNA-binding winged helix-turn-helix (wHTH) protein
MLENHDTRGAISFGPFRLFPAERLLEKDGTDVHLGGRALDILIVLAERAGEVVSKRDLIARVWADVTVDEGSLRFHVAALRKALGEDRRGARYVTNVPGRGYCLVAPVSRSDVPEAERREMTPSRQRQTLPAPLTRMVGRDAAVQKVAQELSARRFVTIVGPGGMGKTTVAVAVAHTLLPVFDGAIHFLDLGSLHDARLVPGALASSLGFIIPSGDPVPSLLASLKDKRILLVFDGCEHVIETVAILAESIFKEAPQIHILATSRESLRVEGEHVHRLLPLDCPPEDARLNASAVLAFPAAQLFVERATASSGHFELSDTDAVRVANICRQLDGIPLAIELAAGRVDAYGIQGVAALLNSRFGLLWQGRRTALPRHQTLRATLDWSYELLSERERVILRRLAVFVGLFTLEAARAVVAGDGIDAEHVVDAIATLAEKSLISPDLGPVPMRYRVRDITRAYLLEKPIESDKAAAIARRHAIYCCRQLERTEAGRPDASRAQGIAPSRRFIGDVLAALEWSFSECGDLAVGTALAAAAAPLFLETSLLTECALWTERALFLRVSRNSSREMVLQESLAVSLMLTQGNTEKVRAAFARGLEIAEALDDQRCQLRLIIGLLLYKARVCDFRGALELGQRAEDIATRLGDPASVMMAMWMVGVADHLVGNQSDARSHCDTAVTRAALPEWANNRLGYGHRNIALACLARALWLTGYPEQAVNVARHALKEAESLEHPVTLCVSMVWTVYVFLWIGDWASAEDLINRIVALASKHSLGVYHAVGLGLKGTLAIKRGDVEGGLHLIRGCLDVLKAGYNILLHVFASELAEGLATAGQFDEALAAIDDAIAQVGGTGESFHMPEMLRIKGSILRHLNRLNSSEAEHYLLQSLDCARKQSALGWELRTATSLARIWAENGRTAEALALLAPVYARITEGFASADLKEAKHLLDDLGWPGSQ